MLVDWLVEKKYVKSKTEARRLVDGGGIDYVCEPMEHGEDEVTTEMRFMGVSVSGLWVLRPMKWNADMSIFDKPNARMHIGKKHMFRFGEVG